MAESRSKKAANVAPSKVPSNKQQVLKKHKSANCVSVKSRFCIMDKVDEGSPVHAGLAKSEGDAWKLAAHAVL